MDSTPTPSTLAREGGIIPRAYPTDPIEKRLAWAARSSNRSGAYRKMLEDALAELTALRAAVAQAEAERDAWKANHDNQVAIKRAIMDRPDLGDRAASVMALVAERDEARANLLAALKEAREDIDHWGSYASEYFQEKWHFADTIRGYDDRIAALSPPAPDGTAPTRPGDDALMGR